jgi:ATP:dephospho-CoA triphosphoribosyl transferase
MAQPPLSVPGGAGSSLGQQRLGAMDLQLLQLGVSPGGSADLLAATLFLDAIERDQTEILPDETVGGRLWNNLNSTIQPSAKY